MYANMQCIILCLTNPLISVARCAVASRCPSGVKRERPPPPRFRWCDAVEKKGRLWAISLMAEKNDATVGAGYVETHFPLRFFDRRSGCRWPAANVAEIHRGNLAEWMALGPKYTVK